MGDISIHKKLGIKSNIRDYHVYFTDDFPSDSHLKSGRKRYFIVDKNVKRLYRNELNNILRRHPHIVIEALEKNKTLDFVNRLIKKLIKDGVKKNFILVAIGGGIIQDITAFTASILYRGIDWVFYPTTLLAQSDSCIGSKTSINIDEYKNQVGNFYPPSHIFLNTKFLRTLSESDIRSGLGEIIKVHLLHGESDLRYINEKYDKSFGDMATMRQLISRSLRIKKDVIEKDEFDSGYRNIMNYGHTFGHALESATAYRLSHGQAVTIGMDISNYISYRRGHITKETYLKMREPILKNWPEYDMGSLDLQLFLDGLKKDKKNDRYNKITAILTKGPGRMMKERLAMNRDFKDMVMSYLKRT